MTKTMTKLQKFNEKYYLIETKEVLIESKLNVLEISKDDETIDLLINSESEELHTETLEHSEVYYAIYEKQTDELVYSDLTFEELEEFIEN